jgi:hypothetical protein
MRVHPLVDSVVDAYLDAIDHEGPGLVEGLYLTGSAALGDFRPHTSDVDFVAVTANRPDAVAIAALQRAHRRLRNRWPKPYFDGLYVTWEELACDPAATRRGPYSYEGRFHARSGGPRNPVTWHTVAHHGIPCRGPQPTDLNIWTDPEKLARWTLDNLDTYWRPLLSCASRLLNRQSLIALTSYGTVWIVLGVSRLHYTMVTGEICSKEGAGNYALQTFPEQWHRLVSESLRIRQADRAAPDLVSAVAEITADLRIRSADDGGSLYRTPFARRRETLAFGDMVITDAVGRYGSGKA